MSAAIVGVGNRHRSDDGAGVYVADSLRAAATDGIDVVASNGDITQMLGIFEQYDCVMLVDALKPAGNPGRLVCFDPMSARGNLLLETCVSSHALGLAEAIAMAEVLDTLPTVLSVIGIEAKSLEPGSVLSEPVQSRCERLSHQLVFELKQARQEIDSEKCRSQLNAAHTGLLWHVPSPD